MSLYHGSVAEWTVKYANVCSDKRERTGAGVNLRTDEVDRMKIATATGV
ncbi:MAG: hypothetical protein KDD59_06720 [Bdellovibrionales bacterium]|nr:hypothetical protein [Bdellovibrionales bacterium]